MAPQQIYQPLRDGEIRLLKVHSRSEFTLESICWTNCTPYTAVSYCWGSAEDQSSISINNVEVPLPKHVAAMLGSLYEHHHVDCVWLDMICIDQCNLTEKARQVELMGQIYSRAEQVYAWLGESNHDIDGAFEVLQKFRDFKKSEILPEHLDAAESLSFYRESFRMICRVRIGLLPKFIDLDDGSLHEEFNWLRSFVMVPYWRRVWIVRELILAKSVIVCCGRQSINFDDIYGLSLDWGSFEQGFDAGVLQIAGRTKLQPQAEAWRIIQAICGHRRRRQVLEWEDGEVFTFPIGGNVGEKKSGSLSIKMLEQGDVAMLDEVIGIYAQNNCKHPRDKVYAFRELIPQWREKLVVDYDARSDKQVFLDVAGLGLLEQGTHGGVHVAFWLWLAMGLGDCRGFDDCLREHFS